MNKLGRPAPRAPKAPWALPGNNTAANAPDTRDKPYLVYKNISVSYEDMARYREGWLSDTNIALWFELLSAELLPAHYKNKVILLNPSVAFYMMHSQSAADIRLILPDLSQAACILIPINDNPDIDAQGGSHWSLLFIDCEARTARHYDSMQRANHNDARRAADVLGELLFTSTAVTEPGLRFLDVKCPRQEDDSSCGVIVCSVTRYIVQRIASPGFTGLQELRHMTMAGAMVDPARAREEIIKILISLKERANSSVSTNNSSDSSRVNSRSGSVASGSESDGSNTANKGQGQGLGRKRGDIPDNPERNRLQKKKKKENLRQC